MNDWFRVMNYCNWSILFFEVDVAFLDEISSIQVSLTFSISYSLYIIKHLYGYTQWHHQLIVAIWSHGVELVGQQLAIDSEF